MGGRTRTEPVCQKPTTSVFPLSSPPKQRVPFLQERTIRQLVRHVRHANALALKPLQPVVEHRSLRFGYEAHYNLISVMATTVPSCCLVILN